MATKKKAPGKTIKLPVDQSGLHDPLPEAEQKKKAFHEGNRDDSGTSVTAEENADNELNNDQSIVNDDDTITEKK